MVHDRKIIAKKYFLGWFVIDIISCIPISDIVIAFYKYDSYARIRRLGSLHKLVRISKFLRLLKIFTDKLFKFLTKNIKINPGFQRLFFFLLIIIIFIHLSGCLLILIAIDENNSYKSFKSNKVH